MVTSEPPPNPADDTRHPDCPGPARGRRCAGQALEFAWLRSWERADNGAQCQRNLNDHFGTHLDAPSHVVCGAPSVDQLDLARLFGEAVVIDCSYARGRD